MEKPVARAAEIATARDALKEAQERRAQEIDLVLKDHARELNEARSRRARFDRLFGSEAKGFATVDWFTRCEKHAPNAGRTVGHGNMEKRSTR